MTISGMTLSSMLRTTDNPTDISLWILCIHASAEKGFTMPLVPTMEMPSTTPTRGLNVLAPTSLPKGTVMVTIAPLSCGNKGCRFSRIIRWGVSLMAGPPIGNPNPGSVTLPTPSPPRIRISWCGSSVSTTSACISKPSVISGSSPACLMTVAVFPSTRSTATSISSPSGILTITLF